MNQNRMVTCRSNKRVPNTLTVGDDYEVLCVLEDICISGLACALAYCVECDDGIERVYSAERFTDNPAPVNGNPAY